MKACDEALRIARQLYPKAEFPDGHTDLAASLNNLGRLYQSQRKYADAEPLLKGALDMNKRLFAGDHRSVAASLINVGRLYQSQEKYADAETLYKGALDMNKRLFAGDHRSVALSMSNLGRVSASQGKYADAETLLKDALNMSRRILVAFAKAKSEGEALTNSASASLPLYCDAFLSFARQRALAPAAVYDPATAYPALWAAKGTIARVFEQRQLQARAASTDPQLSKPLAELADARRRRAELLLAPATKDSTTQQRANDLEALDTTITKLNGELTHKLPALARMTQLDNATLAELQKVLPTDTAVVDFYHYTYFEWDANRPAGEKQKYTKRYLAFVVTRDKVAWVDLDTAANIEPAVNAWREAVTSGQEIPAAVPAKVRELVWDKVRKELPANIKTVYICPDQALCGIPFAALPGDKAGTVLLEDFAVATIPQPSPFLLDQLWPQDPLKNPPTSALVVGGVKYNAELAPPVPDPNALVNRGDPLVKPGAKLGWSFLDNTVGEANGFVTAAELQETPPRHGSTARRPPPPPYSRARRPEPRRRAPSPLTVSLPTSRSAASSNSARTTTRRPLGVERRAAAVNSPLVMTGLVFAGANNPTTPRPRHPLPARTTHRPRFERFWNSPYSRPVKRVWVM